MKTFSALLTTYLRSGRHRGNLGILARLLVLLLLIVVVYSVGFHVLMEQEGQSHSWLTGFYWTMVTMSTLGFGDITFQSDLGRVFSVIVLATGTIYLLILLPFTFIQFFYAPWLEARDAARAPRELPADLTGHVLLTGYGPIETALIPQLQQFRTPYVIIVPDLAEALRLHDEGLYVMVGDLDNPGTYERARVKQAALVAATRADTANTNIAFTVREVSSSVPVVTTASADESVDILRLAGSSQVLQLGDLLGGFLARRVYGGDGRSHVVGHLDNLLIAEASASRTALVGRRLRELNLPGRMNVTVGGIWERGRFTLGGPDTVVAPNAVLLLAGTREQLDRYDQTYGVAADVPAFVVIIGAGRVGQATAAALGARGIEYRLVDKQAARVRDASHLVMGDAADLDVLKAAGIERATCAIVTTHDDDVNVYLTLYCRRLRPNMLILSRATLERNTSTLHRAGADFVLSLASMGANAIFNQLRGRRVVLVAEGLEVFTVPVPRGLAGQTLIETQLRQQTGCNLLAMRRRGALVINPEAGTRLDQGDELVVMADTEAERKFFELYKV
jgi:Trk K+ transport system NAD-binding subunit